MPDQAEYSDEYVANMLKQDAHASSIKYSALGLQAFLPQRATTSAPKPNTRFLRNILRETDTHNAALLAKEKREARERERALNRKEPGRLSPYRGSDSKSADNSAGSHRTKRRREHGVEEAKDRRSRRHDRSPRSLSRSRSPERRRRSRDTRDHRRKRRRRARSSDSGSDSERIREHRSERRAKRRSRERRNGDDGCSRHRHRNHISRSRSREKNNYPDGERRHIHTGDSTPPRQPRASRTPRHTTRRSRRTPPSSDSDPLESIIGPAPPTPEPKIKSKGRGTFNSSSAAIDSHFASNYDPTVDVQPDPESEDDWQQSLEALRDRQKWKQQGADRLRSAGFSEAEVKKWEKGDAKDESDVRWAKKGEGREWDRGKVIGDDHVDLKPTWSKSTQ